MSNLAVKVIDRLFLVVCGVADPNDAEWAAYLDMVKRHGVDRTIQIVATAGGGPTSAQRRRLDHLLAGRTVPLAVLSGSIRVRWGVTLVSWFRREVRAFRPSKVRDALAFLEIPMSRTNLIERELSRLRQEVGGPQEEHERCSTWRENE